MALMRLVVKPGDSLTSTVSFPIAVATAVMTCTVSSLVSSAFTTSTSFILCTGLKKCMPPIRLRAIEHGGHLGDAEAGGVRGDDGISGGGGLHLRQQSQLQLHRLGGGLDDDPGAGHRLGHRGRGRQPRQHRRGLVWRDLAEVNALGHHGLDGQGRRRQRRCGDVVEAGRVAGGERGVRDAVAHDAGAEHGERSVEVCHVEVPEGRLAAGEMRCGGRRQAAYPTLNARSTSC